MQCVCVYQPYLLSDTQSGLLKATHDSVLSNSFFLFSASHYRTDEIATLEFELVQLAPLSNSSVYIYEAVTEKCVVGEDSS